NLGGTFSGYLPCCSQFAAYHGDHVCRAVRSVIMEVVFPADGGEFCVRRRGKRPHPRKRVTYVACGKFDSRKKVQERTQQIFNLFLRWHSFPRVTLIWNFCGSYEHLSVPWNDEYRATVRCLCVDCGVGGPRETWQHNVRSTNASYHRTASMDGGT